MLAVGNIYGQSNLDNPPAGLYQKPLDSGAQREPSNFPIPVKTDPRLIALKNYLTSPPEQIQAVYERSILRERDEPLEPKVLADGSVNRKKKRDLFMLRWCRSGFALVNSEDAQLAENPDSVAATNVITISGSVSNKLWSLEPAVETTVAQFSTNKQRYIVPATLVYLHSSKNRSEPPSFYLQKVLTDETVVKEIIQLGIRNCRPGSLKWEGDKFEGLTYDARALHGSIVISNGAPKELSYFIGDDSYSVKLYYLEDPAQLLPSGFLSRSISPSRPQELDDAYEVHFHSFEASTLPRLELLEPGAFIKGSPYDVYTESNGIMRNVKSGTVISMNLPATPKHKMTVRITLLAIFLLPLLIFALQSLRKRSASRYTGIDPM